MSHKKIAIDEMYCAIDRAFVRSAWPRPSPDSLSYDISDPETIKVVKKLDLEWPELLRSGQISSVRWDLPLLPSPLFAYFLPAFMKASLIDNTGLWLDVVNQFAPPWKHGTSPRFSFDICMFNIEQRKVISDFLDLIIRINQPKKNIEKRLRAINDYLDARRYPRGEIKEGQ